MSLIHAGTEVQGPTGYLPRLRFVVSFSNCEIDDEISQSWLEYTERHLENLRLYPMITDDEDIPGEAKRGFVIVPLRSLAESLPTLYCMIIQISDYYGTTAMSDVHFDIRSQKINDRYTQVRFDPFSDICLTTVMEPNKYLNTDIDDVIDTPPSDTNLRRPVWNLGVCSIFDYLKILSHVSAKTQRCGGDWKYMNTGSIAGQAICARYYHRCDNNQCRRGLCMDIVYRIGALSSPVTVLIHDIDSASWNKRNGRTLVVSRSDLRYVYLECPGLLPYEDCTIDYQQNGYLHGAISSYLESGSFSDESMELFVEFVNCHVKVENNGPFPGISNSDYFEQRCEIVRVASDVQYVVALPPHVTGAVSLEISYDSPPQPDVTRLILATGPSGTMVPLVATVSIHHGLRVSEETVINPHYVQIPDSVTTSNVPVGILPLLNHPVKWPAPVLQLVPLYTVKKHRCDPCDVFYIPPSRRKFRDVVSHLSTHLVTDYGLQFARREFSALYGEGPFPANSCQGAYCIHDPLGTPHAVFASLAGPGFFDKNYEFKFGPRFHEHLDRKAKDYEQSTDVILSRRMSTSLIHGNNNCTDDVHYQRDFQPSYESIRFCGFEYPMTEWSQRSQLSSFNGIHNYRLGNFSPAKTNLAEYNSLILGYQQELRTTMANYEYDSLSLLYDGGNGFCMYYPIEVYPIPNDPLLYDNWCLMWFVRRPNITLMVLQPIRDYHPQKVLPTPLPAKNSDAVRHHGVHTTMNRLPRMWKDRE